MKPSSYEFQQKTPKRLSNVRSFMVSFFYWDRAQSIQKREMKLSGVSIFFENARKIFKSNLVVLVVLKSKGP